MCTSQLTWDVFEPSIMAATANPEPGGFGWYQVLEILQTVCDKATVVGFDVTGLCPIKYNKAPNLLAAKTCCPDADFPFCRYH